MKSLLLTSMLTLAMVFAFGQTNTKYTQTLNQYFKATGASETFEVVIEQMIDLQKQQYPEVGNEFWDEAEDEFKSASMKDLAEMLTPVYEKYLTMEDLQEIIDFYNSPAGKKMAKATPAITQESMVVGEQWGYKIAERILEKME